MLGYLTVIILSSNNLVSSWRTPPGRFWTTVTEIGMSLPMSASICLVVIGLVILNVEYFKE